MFKLKDCIVVDFIIWSEYPGGTTVLVRSNKGDMIKIRRDKECFSKSDYDYILGVLDQENEDDPCTWDEIDDQLKTFFKESYVSM